MSKEREVLKRQIEHNDAQVVDETNTLNLYLVHGPNNKEDSVLLRINYQSEDYIKSLKVMNIKTGVVGSPNKRSVYNSKNNTMVDSYYFTVQNVEHLLLSIIDLRLLIDINYRLCNLYISRSTNILDKYKDALKKAIKASLIRIINKFKTASATMEDYSVIYAMEAPSIVDYIYESSMKMKRSELLVMLGNQNLLFKELI